VVSQSPIRSDLHGKRVLLIDHCQATREARAAVLRSHGVEVHEAEEISAARFLWQPHVYDLVMLDARRYSSEATREFYEQIKVQVPGSKSFSSPGPQSTSRIHGPVKSPAITPRANSGVRR